MAKPLPKFQQVQYQFTRHMRDPDNNPGFDDIEARRIKVYSDLLFNNVEGFLANSFPVLKSVIDDERWRQIVREYFKNHHARTPLFPKMPQEFLHYLSSQYEPAAGDPAFIHELAHYEWLELETLLDGQEITDQTVDDDANVLDDVPVLSALARAHGYQFPVHRISKDFIPQEPPGEPTFLVVYRDRQDKVGFMVLNPTTARLIELIASQQKPCSGRELLQQIAAEMGHTNPEIVISGGLQIMQELLDKDVLLGARSR